MPKMEEDKGEEVVEEAEAEEAVAEEINVPLNPDKEDVLPLKPDLEEVKTEFIAVDAIIKKEPVEAPPQIKPIEVE